MIGDKRERITIWRNQSVQVPGGGMSEPVEVLYWDTWAQVKPIKAKRTLDAFQVELKGGFELKVRYRKDKEVTKDMTVKFRGKNLVVHSVINEGEMDTELTIIGMRND